MKKVQIYSKYERFWHWTQAALIITLAITGFEVHSSYEILGYKEAVLIHRNLAWALMILIIFTLFWNFITGEWRQYIPSMKMMKEQIDYYITGIFKNAPHPTNKTVYNKFNPLQRMTYLGLRILVIPIVVFSGAVYMYFSVLLEQEVGLPLVPIAYIHTVGAFLLIGFMVIHIYLTTTGHKPLSAIKAMLSGWEEMSDEEAQIALEENLLVAMDRSRKSIAIEDENAEEEKEHMFEEAFEEASERLGLITEATRLQSKLTDSNVGYFKVNIEGFYEDVNDAWLNLYKCKNKSDVVNAHITLNRTEEGKEKIMDLFNRVLKGEVINGERTQRLCKDGSIGYHTVSAKAYKDEKGKITGIEGFIIDITHQVEAENDLESKLNLQIKNEEFYKKMIASKNIGYYRIGKNGFMQEVNDTWLSLYKYKSKDEVINKHYSLSRTKEDFLELKKSVDRVLQGETIPFGVTRRYCQDGSIGYHSITMTPVYEGKEIVGFEGFIVDKTDKKMAEKELLESREREA